MNKLIPTTVVGSYPQPDWLVDRAALSKLVPRVRMPEIWRIAPEFLEQAQDDFYRDACEAARDFADAVNAEARAL